MLLGGAVLFYLLIVNFTMLERWKWRALKNDQGVITAFVFSPMLERPVTVGLSERGPPHEYEGSFEAPGPGLFVPWLQFNRCLSDRKAY